MDNDQKFDATNWWLLSVHKENGYELGVAHLFTTWEKEDCVVEMTEEAKEAGHYVVWHNVADLLGGIEMTYHAEEAHVRS